MYGNGRQRTKWIVCSYDGAISRPLEAGHTSVSFTLDRYGGLFEGHDRELRDPLDAMFTDAHEGQVLAFDRGASGPKVVPDSS
jgi:hypothetical protein